MFKPSNEEYMNQAVADFVIRIVQEKNPGEVTPKEMDSLANLVRAVNSAPKTIELGQIEEFGETMNKHK